MSDTINGILASVATAYGTYGPVANATPAGITAISEAVQSAIGSLTAMAAAADIPAGAPGGLVAGGPPANMAAALVAQAAMLTQGAVAQNVLPIVRRIALNLGPAGSAGVMA
jgi:hypothetical protein